MLGSYDCTLSMCCINTTLHHIQNSIFISSILALQFFRQFTLSLVSSRKSPEQSN